MFPAAEIIENRKYGVSEYFDVLEKSVDRCEFHNGEIRILESGTADHSRIKLDTANLLGNHALSRPYEPFDNDLTIYIPKWNSYLLPDLSFVYGSARFGDDARRRLLNPALLVEVISDSSEDNDRGEKFWKYRSIESFREYLLIDSRRYAVECWYKENDNTWRLDEAFARDESVYLHTLEVDLPLEEIYRRVNV